MNRVTPFGLQRAYPGDNGLGFGPLESNMEHAPVLPLQSYLRLAITQQEQHGEWEMITASRYWVELEPDVWAEIAGQPEPADVGRFRMAHRRRKLDAPAEECGHGHLNTEQLKALPGWLAYVTLP